MRNMNIMRPFFSINKKESIAIILIVIIAASFYFPLIWGLSKTVINENDWWRNYYYAGLSRKTVIDYHQLPLRTPFMSGGYSFIGHPSDFSLSPLFVFILIFGEVIGLRILVFLIFISGALGMFYLTKYVLKYNLLGGIFSSLAFILCNWGAYEAADGNLQKLFYYFLPWLLAFFIKSKQDKRFIVFSVFILSLILLNNALILPPVILLLFLFSCFNSIEVKRGFKIKLNTVYITSLLLIVVVTCLLCAVKILPFLQLYSMKVNQNYPLNDYSYAYVSHSVKTFGSCLDLARLNSSLFDPKFRNYSVMYFGYIPVIIFILSILFCRRGMLSYIIIFMVFTLIQFGPNSSIDLFKILWRLHPFGYSMWRLDKYFGFFSLFFISLIGGRFFSIFEGKKRSLLMSGLLIIIISIANMYWQNRLIFQDIIYEKTPVFKKYDSFFQSEVKKVEIERDLPGYSGFKDIRSYQPFWVLLNQNVGSSNLILHGTINIGEYAVPKYILETGGLKGECVYVKGYDNLSKYDTVDLISSAIGNPLYRGEVFTLNPENKAELIYFSPNEIKIGVKITNTDKIIINQNYHKSWKTNKGRLINYQGLLGIEFNNIGSYIVELKYRPLDFFVGLCISILTLIGLIRYLYNVKKTLYV